MSQGNLLQKRVIYSVLKPKAPQQVQEEEGANEMKNS